MRRGFTLVELSIVLVIIGLLTGGILIGQSLIQTATIQNEVRKIQQYSIALVNFRNKFRQEAGDSNLFIPRGNNNKDTNNTSGSCPSSMFFEAHSAWAQLSQSQMISENYVWSSPTYCTGRSTFGTNEVLEDIAPVYFPEKSRMVSTNHIYLYGYRESPQYPYAGKTFFRRLLVQYDPYIVWGIENKIDDGVLSNNTGNINSRTSPGNLLCNPENVEAQDAFCSIEIFWSKSLEVGIY